jgi:hypothetical protein
MAALMALCVLHRSDKLMEYIAARDDSEIHSSLEFSVPPILERGWATISPNEIVLNRRLAFTRFLNQDNDPVWLMDGPWGDKLSEQLSFIIESDEVWGWSSFDLLFQ